MKIIGFLLLFCTTTAFAQDKLMAYFPGLTHADQMDTMSFQELLKIVDEHPDDFRQAYFDYGYDDPEDWVLVSETIHKTPDVTRPFANSIDLNHDGIKDIILSFRGGNEYTRMLIYFGTKTGYKNVHYAWRILYGIYENGDLLLRHPACCTDPSNEFHRISIDENGEVTMLDSIAIGYRGFKSPPSYEGLFDQKEWTVSKDTLYPVSPMEGVSTYDGYLPGAQIRIIDETVHEGDTLRFCEIKGEMMPKKRYRQFYPHSFTWLTNKRY